MASLLNTPGNSVTFGNTGTPASDIRLGLPKGVFLTGLDYKIEDADLADLESKLQDDVLAGLIFPIKTFVGMEDKTTDAVYGTTGYGTKEKQNDEVPAYDFHVMCGVGLAKRLKTFDGKQMRVIILTKQKLVHGTTPPIGVLAGYFANVSVSLTRFANGTDPRVIKVGVEYIDSNEQVETATITPDFDPFNINGLLDVDVTNFSQGVKTMKIKLTQSISKTDLLADYSTELAVVGAVSIINVSTNLPVAAATVTYDSANSALTIGFTAGGTYDISLVSPTALAELGVIGFESNTLSSVVIANA